MDLDTQRLNRKIKDVKEISTYSESAIITIDDAINEAYKLIDQLEELKQIQRKNLQKIYGTQSNTIKKKGGG